MIGVILFLLGLCAGSFANATAWRLYKQTKSKKKADSGKYSILHGRSMCESCGHILAWYDLAPIFSWLSLMGKCRYCHKKLTISHLLVELATGLVFLFSYIYWPLKLDFAGSILLAVWLAIIVGLAVLFIYDLQHMILPTKVVRILIVLAFSYQVIRLFDNYSFGFVLRDSLLGVVVGGGMFWLLYQLSKGNWIGGGDVRLGAMFGLLLGPVQSAGMIFIASCLGVVVSLPLMLNKKAKLSSRIPYGPFLIIAGVIMQIFGASLVAWYKRKFVYL